MNLSLCFLHALQLGSHVAMDDGIGIDSMHPHAQRAGRDAGCLDDLGVKGRILDKEHVELVEDVSGDGRLVVELELLEEVLAVDEDLAVRPAEKMRI